MLWIGISINCNKQASKTVAEGLFLAISLQVLGLSAEGQDDSLGATIDCIHSLHTVVSWTFLSAARKTSANRMWKFEDQCAVHYCSFYYIFCCLLSVGICNWRTRSAHLAVEEEEEEEEEDCIHR
ncbi:hypothetical protein SUGI_1041060 [Cryptomeria japonica]|nr:hypothetical protein SUGI_1041060 [Cryptomeria japonica]